MAARVGIESELLLISSDGRVTPLAPQVLSVLDDPSHFVPENSAAMVEINSDPALSVSELESSLMGNYHDLHRVAREFGVIATPTSDASLDDVPMPYLKPRYAFNAQVLGEGYGLFGAVTGTHVHVERHPRRALDQYVLMQSLDPMFAFASASPMVRGRSHSNGMRTHTIRDRIFEQNPEHGNLHEYPSSLEDIDRRGHELRDIWLSRIGDRAAAQDHYDETNTNWGPIRMRHNTIEARNIDSLTPTMTLAIAALYKGVDDAIIDGSMAVRVAHPGDEVQYALKPEEIVVPSFPYLKELERRAMVHGLEDPLVRGYAQHVLSVAQGGLEARDQKYLIPLAHMLATHRNISSQLRRDMQALSPEAAGIYVHNALADAHRSDLERYGALPRAHKIAV